MSKNDPKYDFQDNRIVNVASGEKVPEDEPVFVFLARDVHTMDLLRAYGRRVKDPYHQKTVQNRIDVFEQWQRDNPGKMKEPDTQPAEDSDVIKCEDCGDPVEGEGDVCDSCFDERVIADEDDTQS